MSNDYKGWEHDWDICQEILGDLWQMMTERKGMDPAVEVRDGRNIGRLLHLVDDSWLHMDGAGYFCILSLKEVEQMDLEEIK